MKLKWVFAALILTNLGLWMWASWYRDRPVEETRAPRAPVTPEKMRLFNEPGVKLVPRKAPPPANAELTASVAPACFHIGPFPDVDLVARAEARLNELPLTYSRRAEESRYTGAIESHPSPLGIVWGDLDPIAVHAMTDRLLEVRADATRITLDGVGHYPMVEAPDRFSAAVLAALDTGR